MVPVWYLCGTYKVELTVVLVEYLCGACVVLTKSSSQLACPLRYVQRPGVYLQSTCSVEAKKLRRK